MEKASLAGNHTERDKNGLIVVAGAGGFIAGSLVRYFQERGFTRIRAIDKKPLPEWYQHVPGVESLCLDLSEKESCIRACEGAWEVYNLAADMGGMGFIERFRIECLRSVLINTHLIEAANRAGAERYFYSSSACAYNTDLQKDPKVRASERVGRLPRHGRARLRMGKAFFGNGLPGILGRARDEDLYCALPQCVWAARNLGRRAGESSGGDVPQGDRSQGRKRKRNRHLG